MEYIAVAGSKLPYAQQPAGAALQFVPMETTSFLLCSSNNDGRWSPFLGNNWTDAKPSRRG